MLRILFRKFSQATRHRRIRNISVQTISNIVIRMSGEKETFIYKDIHRYTYEGSVFFDGKPIVITVHAIKRARERDIAFPDQIYKTIRNGKARRFAKKGVKFVMRTKTGTIICIGEDVGHAIIIKTVERGN